MNVNPGRLSELCKFRAERMGTFSQGYANLDHIYQEMDYAFHLYGWRRDWPLVDVTTKSIEQSAAEMGILLDRSLKAH